MGYNVSFALLTSRTFLFNNPLVVKKYNSKHVLKIVDRRNLENIQWLSNKVTVRKEDIDFRVYRKKKTETQILKWGNHIHMCVHVRTYFLQFSLILALAHAY